MRSASNYIMRRSFAEAMGFAWPPEVACVVNGRRVTWAERREQKRQRQAERLERIRSVEEPVIVPGYVWTFYIPGWLYTGWWCYLVTRHEQIPVAFRGRVDDGAACQLMADIPLGLLPMRENWPAWKAAFAQTYPRLKTKDPRKAGSLVGWVDLLRVRFARTKGDLLTSL